MSFFDPQNPGLGGLKELTSTETALVQALAALGDPNADRILFWDDSAGSYAYLSLGTGLTITGTTIDAAAASGASAALDNLSAVAINAALLLGTSDAFALGSTTKMWSDLFLASGAVINFNNGDVTLTHSAGILTLAGTLALGANSITMTGSIGTTANRLTKGWFTDLQVTNAIAGSVTGNAATVTTNANLTGHITSVGNAAVLGSFTLAQLNTAVSDADVARIDAGNTFVGASTASAWVLTSPTITTKISPTSDDGAPLGDTTHNFSDLFLASGALINIANSNWVATHTSGILTVTTGELRVTSANVGTNADSIPTLSSTSTLTNKTLTSPTLTTPSAFTTGGTITLAENTSLALDPAGSADGKYTGITIAATSGYTQAFGDLVTLDKDDSRWEAVDISVAAAATGDARGIMGMVVSTGTDGNACTILLQGIIRADANFPALTIGAAVFASTTGDIVVTQPTTTDHVIRIVGYALTADEIYFNPDNVWVTHT